MLRIHDKSFEVFLTQEAIQREITTVAERLNSDYAGKQVVFIAVLNGAFMFAADLLKRIELSCEISFVKLTSYEGTASSGNVCELIGLQTDLKGKEVIVLEDIVDTGLTMDKLMQLVNEKEPASVKLVTLLFKPEAFRGTNNPHYIGFSIPDKFVVGYGLDYNERGRNTEHIYQLKE